MNSMSIHFVLISGSRLLKLQFSGVEAIFNQTGLWKIRCMLIVFISLFNSHLSGLLE